MENSAAEQLGSVPGVPEKLGTGLRENCFGDKEVAILAFSQEQFTDGTERTFFCPLSLQIYSSCFLLYCLWSPPEIGQLFLLGISFLHKKKEKKNIRKGKVFTLGISQRGQEL